jgi:hypothetical protein
MKLQLAPLALASFLTAACGPPALDCSTHPVGHVTVGTGAETFEPIGADGVLIQSGPQGGHHLWVGIRCEDLGSSVTVRYGIRRKGTNESLSPEGLARQVDLDTAGEVQEAGGLYGYLNDGLDLDALIGAEVTLWASVTGECGDPPAGGAADTKVTGWAP